MENIVFKEEQKMKSKWLWAVVLFGALLPVIISIVGLIVQIGYGQQFGNNPMGDTGMIIMAIFSTLFSAGLITLFAVAKLETIVNDDRISFRYYPLQMRFKDIILSDIVSFEVKKYSPMGDYGGWGIRYGFNRGMAYNVSGDMGAFIIQKNGKKILIGTQMPEELNNALNSLLKK